MCIQETEKAVEASEGSTSFCCTVGNHSIYIWNNAYGNYSIHQDLSKIMLNSRYLHTFMHWQFTHCRSEVKLMSLT